MTTAEVTTLTAAIVLGALQAWNTYKSSKRDKAIAATAKTVETIHTLTNSAMGLQKQNLARVTLALATLTNDPKDLEAAKEALDDMVEHDAKQKIVDSKLPTDVT